YRPSDRTIILSEYVTQPALAASLITHEAVNARLIPAGAASPDSETEAYKEQGEEARWFDATFGRPDFGPPEPGVGPNRYQDALWTFSEAIPAAPRVVPAFGGCCTLVKA
ncbi:MAG: hypothetical protein KGL39_31555, partial [Patescibacteria group bacterium]|nr:hypothetical protein [Patescibacteria group bacterium]